ncbi:MAG: glutamyl-tRNA reductase [Anaerolineales bacterium]|nr:glutamyl-tRNA reductase [Anaerolineales bacterium]
MHILSIGLNHTTAPIELRERLSFGEDQVRTALARMSCSHTDTTCNMKEMVILSTCNRIEIYVASNHKSFSGLEAFLSDARGVPVDGFHPHLYRFVDAEAVRHLLDVAAGLDSLVLGEPQILGQVTRALELARGIGASGPLLSRLFQAAIHAGKRARTETAISRNPASVSSLAASLCERSAHDIKKAQIVVLGAGEMAELAVEALRKRGAHKLVVINRTLERAHALAARWSAEADTFENLERALVRADILITSTGAPHTIIGTEMVDSAMRQRSKRPLTLVDIAVPRDVDPDVAQIPDVHLYDIDNLNVHLEQSLAERASEVPCVEAILDEEEGKFIEFLASLDMLPLISDMHRKAEAIRQAELNKTLRRLPDLSEAERARIEALTQALVKKLLDAPTTRLRAQANTPNASEYASLTRTLFGLSTGD